MTTITGTAGADTLVGTSGDDSISGVAGNDIIAGLGGRNTIDGGPGYNVVTYATAAGNMYGDVHAMHGGNYSLDGGVAYDTLYNIQGVIGSAYADNIAGDLNANWLSGGGDADTLEGGGGSDTLNGVAGDDWLYAGDGNDLLTGGPGNDVFRIDGSGQKSVTDFTHGQDKIDVAKGGYDSFAQLTSSLSQVGADTVLTMTVGGQPTSYTLKNVAAPTVTAGDFLFRPARPANLADAGIVGGHVDAYQAPRP